jgi:hypothetical protein
MEQYIKTNLSDITYMSELPPLLALQESGGIHSQAAFGLQFISSEGLHKLSAH